MSDERQLFRAEHLADFLNASQRQPDDPYTALPGRSPVYIMLAVAALVGIGGFGISKLLSGQQPSQQVPAQAARPDLMTTRALVETAPVATVAEGSHRTTAQNIVNSDEVGGNAPNRQTSKPVSSAVRDRSEKPALATRDDDGGLPPSSKVVESPRQKPVSAQEPAAIEPYRNGTMATRLTGERLRLALIEDRRLTKKMNEAALRQIRAQQPNGQPDAERP